MMMKRRSEVRVLCRMASLPKIITAGLSFEARDLLDSGFYLTYVITIDHYSRRPAPSLPNDTDRTLMQCASPPRLPLGAPTSP